ncbi:MAG: hypothetical protein ACPG4T_04595 [Nannocystaceae bacterium]
MSVAEAIHLTQIEVVADSAQVDTQAIGDDTMPTDMIVDGITAALAGPLPFERSIAGRPSDHTGRPRNRAFVVDDLDSPTRLWASHE